MDLWVLWLIYQDAVAKVCTQAMLYVNHHSKTTPAKTCVPGRLDFARIALCFMLTARLLAFHDPGSTASSRGVPCDTPVLSKFESMLASIWYVSRGFHSKRP